MDELTTYAENTWCPGCGNFAIFNAYKQAVAKLAEKGILREKLFITAGIGCHGKIFDYLNISGFYSLHGRSMATAQGIKMANPDLTVVTFAGDGDAFGEGLEHMLFAAKRNADITVIVHDNGVYGLTTGQYTPTSAKGFRGPSTPKGSIEEPLNPLALMLSAGASFVARGYSGKLPHLVEMMIAAITHPGFAFLDVLQPCVSFNDTYKKYNELTEIMAEAPADKDKALEQAQRTDRFPLGIFYRQEKPLYHKLLYGDKNPVTDSLSMEERRKRVQTIISGT
jgi:2-oxoglutarate ferredoxin oxidoreductase subunit beta